MGQLALTAAILAPVVAFIVWMYRTTDYRIDGTDLFVRSGPMSWKVELASVRRLRATRSPMSAPALSLDRIEIEYGRHGSVLVSPADKREFIRAITAHAPSVAMEGLDDFR